MTMTRFCKLRNAKVDETSPSLSQESLHSWHDNKHAESSPSQVFFTTQRACCPMRIVKMYSGHDSSGGPTKTLRSCNLRAPGQLVRVFHLCLIEECRRLEQLQPTNNTKRGTLSWPNGFCAALSVYSFYASKSRCRYTSVRPSTAIFESGLCVR